jgi:hypothetical protein
VTDLADHLLAAERQKGGVESYFFPALVAVINLVLCAYCESAVRRDATAMALFLFFEGAVVLTLSAAQLSSTTMDMLSKSRIFPVTSRSRLRFAIVADLRRPAMIAVIGSTALFLVVLCRHSLLQAIAAPIAFAAFAVVTEMVFVVFTLIVSRHAVPISGIFSLIAIAVIATFFTTLILHLDLVLSLNPLVFWTSGSINAAGRADLFETIEYTAFLSATGACAIAVGRRYA